MKKALRVILPLLLVVLILGGGFWYFKTYQGALLSDFLASRGDAAMESERYGRAVRYYQWAWDLDDSDPDLAIRLAAAYRGDDNYTKAEFTLVNAISKTPEEIDLYLALSETYVLQDKLLDASEMLDNIANETARTELTQMRPEAPELTPESGYYTEYISVSASAAEGTIYMSVDGSFPSVENGAYTEPVQLSAGESKAVAVTVGENYLVSSATYAAYTIGGVVEEVTLSASALDAYVRELLGVDSESVLMTNQLWTITEMTISSEVTSLEDLKYFTGLKSLTIQNRQTDDFGFLSNLSQLEQVDFSGSLITTQTIELLGNQKNLKHLNLSSCGVSNLSGLSGCTQLEYLNLNNDQVADLSPLSGCTNLTELYLSGNAVTALDDIAALTSLQKLDLSYNAVQNLGALAACTQLSELNISHCSLVDLSAVGSLTSLTVLNASANELESISGLENCTNLTKVDLSDNKLTSVDALGQIDSLKEININYNDVVNVPSFSSSSQLEKFYADHNFLEDLSGLANCPNLNYVTLDYNNISNINVLADCPNLVEVNVFGTNIHSADAVQTLLDRGIIVNYDPS